MLDPVLEHILHFAGIMRPVQVQICILKTLPMGVEARVQGRTMEVEVPIRPRSSQTFQLRKVLIRGTQQSWGDPIRLGSSRTFQPLRLGETLRGKVSWCLLRTSGHPGT